MFLEDNIGTAERAFCECDLEFVNGIDGLSRTNKDYDTTQCVPHSGGGHGSCCEAPTGLYSRYNDEYFQCCSGNVVPYGSC